MIRNSDSKSKFFFSLVAALVLHTAILAFIKYDVNDFAFLTMLSQETKNLSRPLKLDNIDLIKPEDVEKFRKVGVKNGKKDLQRPDLSFKTPITQTARPAPPNKDPKKGSTGKSDTPASIRQDQKLSLNQLAPELPTPVKKLAPQNSIAKNFMRSSNDSGNHFYFNYKDQKVIPRSQDQEILKSEAVSYTSAPMNKATEKMTNFEIRYERPEGVSEDELNSDEKAYYSFYVRSYQNYYSKIYSTYEKMVIERPGLAKVFDKKYLLIGKIDYDEKGNIVTVKILKSADDDDLHHFFEETLKQLSQPNPPKIFVKNRKQFSIYYQLQIN